MFGDRHEAQLEALRAVLRHVLASPYSDFYRKRLAERSLAPQFPRNIEDWQSLPFVTKDEIAESPIWERTYIPHGEVYSIRYTGGTKKRLITPRRTFGQYGKAAALGGATRMITFFGAVFMSELSRRQLGINTLTCYLPNSPETYAFTVALAKRFGADSLMLLPSAAIEFAPYVEAAGLLSAIKVLELCGERCSPAQAQALRRLYPSAVLVQNYSASDWNGTFGESCTYAIHNKLLSFHIDHEFFFSEFVHPQAQIPVDPSDMPAELVISSLTTDQPFPVIRYRTGDLLAVEDAHCPCGDPTPRFKHMGRVSLDEMKLFGGTFSLNFVEEALAACPLVRPEDFEVQYLQQSIRGVQTTGLRVLVLPKTTDTDLSEVARSLEATLRLGNGRTYGEEVRQDLLLPLEVGILRVPTRTQAGKRVRFMPGPDIHA